MSQSIPRPPSQQPIPPHAVKVFSGVLFDVYQWEQKLFDGRTVLFEKLRRPDTVVVFAVLEDGRILLSEQEQPGKAPFVGALGGRVDRDEDVLTAARRELLEESGYTAESFTLMDAQHPTSKIDWVVYTFIAKGLRKVAEPALDGGEKITLKPVNLDTFMEIAASPNFSEKEITNRILTATRNPAQMQALREMFAP